MYSNIMPYLRTNTTLRKSPTTKGGIEIGADDVGPHDVEREPELGDEAIAIRQRLRKKESSVDEGDGAFARDGAPQMEEHRALGTERRREEQRVAEALDRERQARLGRQALEVLVLAIEVETRLAHAAHSPSPEWTRKPASSPTSARSASVGGAVTSSPRNATTRLPSRRSKKAPTLSPVFASAS